ncbi:hypothetical protein EXM98_04435 [Clostridium botulinum]|uniref:hypothetical protein n=2 Tax=Clostridium botulinum TaxID=1491 RepID=UPI0005F89D73|nr:hypothetical protein [Clostridium botulinum]MBY6800074.1 hypothetical protein [Clostridium botulinum]MBY7010395.1 hypothetical protein [Clostridium botulinum]MCS6164954.1 hypothetical protein [Clostridium botulinum]NEZ94495.1 hypothetical protein [Clostridium botulinum]NFA26930.1 hypothetical protein [Clostridium botulinum]
MLYLTLNVPFKIQGKGEREVWFSTVLNHTPVSINHVQGKNNLSKKELMNLAVSRAKERFIMVTDVIELRKKLLPESNREKCIAKSFLDVSWFNDIKKDYDNVFFLAGGLFAYYDEENIKVFFNNLAKEFPNSGIIFDAPSSKSNNNGTNRAIKKYNLGNIELKLAIKNLKTLQEFSSYIEVNDYFGFFEKINRKKEWGIINNIQMTLNDLLHISNFYHIRFKN